MALRSVAVPLLSGGALLLGYAALAWFWPKPRIMSKPAELHQDIARLSERLEHVPEELALDLSNDPPFDERALPSASALGALFLGRAAAAPSPFELGLGSQAD